MSGVGNRERSNLREAAIHEKFGSIDEAAVVGAAGLAAARAAGLGLPRRNRRFREPDGQAPALAQGDVIGGPIRHSVPLLRDVMTAILVRFEWHGDCPGSGTGPSSYTVHLSPPTTIRATRPRELAFAVGRNGSRRIAHHLRPDLGMLVVADYQVRQALGWEGRAALMSRAIAMGGYS